jgi:hypothetical protein
MSFIDAHDFPAGLVLRVLDVPESTYYDWRARKVSPSRRELDDAALLEQILKIRSVNEFAATYGSPRVWLELRRQACGSGANAWSGSCAPTGCRARTCGGAGGTARPGRTRTTPPRRTWSTETSGPPPRTGSGWPT